MYNNYAYSDMLLWFGTKWNNPISKSKIVHKAIRQIDKCLFCIISKCSVVLMQRLMQGLPKKAQCIFALGSFIIQSLWMALKSLIQQIWLFLFSIFGFHPKECFKFLFKLEERNWTDKI